jgi:hypothetical protein
MQLLLLQSVPGIGEQYEIVDVDEDTGFDILSKRQALLPTLSVRRRFEEQIREGANASSSSSS